MMNTSRMRGYRSAGFTMIEIIIAVLIGLIGIVVIMQVYAVSEGYKRTATTGTDAQVNGAVGLYQVERDLRVAAYGISALLSPPMGQGAACTSIRVYNSASNQTVDLQLTPFQINPANVPAGDPNTDVILMLYGNADSAIIGTFADQGGSPTRYFDVKDNWNGYRNGDLVIGYSPAGGVANGPVCALHELTAVPSGNGNCGQPVPGALGRPWIAHNNGGYPDPNNGCKMKQSTFNSTTGITMSNGQPVPALNKGIGSQIFNFGPLPAWKAYAVRNGNLTVCDLFAQNCNDLTQWQVVAQDIVSLRAIYATSPNIQTTASTWTRNQINTAAQANQVTGVAVALVARSPLIEKPKSGTACDATVNRALPDRAIATPWYQQYLGATDGTIINAAFDLSTTRADWQCYRYKLFQTAVPIRNLTWRPS